MGGWKYGKVTLAGSLVRRGDEVGPGGQWVGRIRQELDLRA